MNARRRTKRVKLTMMNVFRTLLKKDDRLSASTSASEGFTLIELMVSMILAVLVLTPLLSFMINILTTERREQAKAATEEELQATVDYITRDLEQAVYVYDTTALTTNSNTANPASSGIKDQIPPVSGAVSGCSSTATCTPVLAFWKREVYEDAFKYDNTTCTTAAANADECNDAYAYSLVVYYQTTDNSSGIWSNTSRISRFELNGGVRNPTTTNAYFIAPSDGYESFDLSLSGSIEEKLNIWEKGAASYTAPAFVLVDHIDQFVLNAVSTTTSTAEITIRANALSRLEDSPSFNSQLTSFFPSTTIQVRGLGGLGGQ
ncbi:MAG: hormogonium polysaccharide secretion pseudopilin HpsC [Leptolyngbyaceae cyanobacterium MO_188.B28]|nr:hormogonium polysaccharide secretion pseudopilin HpsC [Leptolyngbyaceae cyanobacterium MO_188.B28]